MKNFVFSLRNKIERFLYVNIFKPIFFVFDPEDTHDFMTSVGVTLGRYNLTRKITAVLLNYSDSMLRQNILGIEFKNPIGLAAGFDKEAVLVDILPEVGFGFVEVGSITAKPYGGNEKPRLTRLKKSESLVINYGLKNTGCENISKRLDNRKFKIPVGISIAKTNNKETCDNDFGVEDYVESFRCFSNIGDYLTINISCPNAYGGEPFTEPSKLDKLLIRLDEIKINKPVFLKISPDLDEEQLIEILDVCARHKVDGFICSNLTKDRNNDRIKDINIPEKGGISGRVVSLLSDKQIRLIRKRTGAKYIIVGCGGVFSAEDAYRKIRSGANLIQLITGMIFEGPQVISEINRGLVELLKKDGFNNVSEAVGVDV